MKMRRIQIVCMGMLGLVLSAAGGQAAEELKGCVVAVEKLAPLCDQASNGVYRVQRADKAPVMDGKAEEWKDVPAMVLDRKEQTKGKWDGPQDISGSLRMMWDEKALYFCLEVKDDAHTAPNSASNFWADDCCQIAFDAYMNGPVADRSGNFPKDGYDVDELSFCVSDSPKGSLMACYRQRGSANDKEGLLDGTPVSMSLRADGARVYEWALTWERMEPVSPWILGRSGFGFALNDNDGAGYEGSLCWTEGVVWGQDASKFGQLIFDGAAGTKNAMLPLRPEPKICRMDAKYRWLDLEGVESLGTARLLVRVAKDTHVVPKLTIERAGEKRPVAVGALEADVPAGKMVAFVWDLATLKPGRYELVYSEPSAGEGRLDYVRLEDAALWARRAELRAKFGLDRPWDDMAEAPPLIRRHRGLVAAALQWAEGGATQWRIRDEPNETEEIERQLAALKDATALFSAMDAGEDYLAKQRNQFWAAYYSSADGSGQHFVMVVPEDFSPKKTYPLVVNLHGRDARPMVLRDKVQKYPCLYATPWGRGNVSYAALGEDDVLEIIRYVRQWYKVDTDRIYLTGGSMGGRGTWLLAGRYPDLIAAGAPVCGWMDGMPLENLLNVPIFNQHGDKDESVVIDTSRFGVSALQGLGYAVLHNEIPGGGHNFTGGYNTHDWLLQQKRNNRPDSVVYSCDLAAERQAPADAPEIGKAYWVRVRRFLDPHRRATVKARVVGAGPHQALSLSLANVDALELDTVAMPIDRKAGLLVQVGYCFLKHESRLPERLFVVHRDGQWSLADRWTEPRSDVRPYRPGAAAELYTGEPLLIIWGTAGSEQCDKLLRAAAENLSRFAGSGEDMWLGLIRAKPDTEVTEEDINHFNLILLGSARDNALTARVLPKLPLTITGKNELVAGDRDPVSLAGAGIRLAYYNPLSPKRLIFLIATDEEGAATEKWLKEARGLMTGSDGFNRVDEPDLVVQSLLGTPRRFMQFTHDWQWRKMEGADIKAPEAMANSRAMTLARLRVMRRTTGADFAFWWGAKPEDKEFDPQWFTLADMATARTPEQTLLCRMSGEDLIDVHKRWIEKGELTVVPDYKQEEIDPKRDYRVAMPPWLCGDLAGGRQKNLRDVEAGPEWRQEDLWAEVFGEEAVRKAK